MNNSREIWLHLARTGRRTVEQIVFATALTPLQVRNSLRKAVASGSVNKIDAGRVSYEVTPGCTVPIGIEAREVMEAFDAKADVRFVA